MIRSHVCRCEAHAQHRLLSIRFFHPSASLKDASVELKITYSYAKVLWGRLRQRSDFGKLCPLCFAPGFLPEGCQRCGFEAGSPEVFEETETQAAQDPKKGWVSPVHKILPDRGLGSYLTVGNYATLARRMYSTEKLDHTI